MDIYNLSPSIRINKRDVILIQDVENWATSIGWFMFLEKYDRNHRLSFSDPSARNLWFKINYLTTDQRVRATEYLLAKELFEIFALPITLRNPATALSRELYQAFMRRPDDGFFSRLQYGRELLFAPPRGNTSEIEIWSIGFTLYMRYQSITSVGRPCDISRPTTSTS